MAGTPIKRKMIAELERRAVAMTKELGEEHPLGPLDVIHDHVASGGTIMDLVQDIGAAIGFNLSARSGVLSMWINSTPEGRAMIAQAREIASHALVEQAQQLVDDVDEDKSAIAKAKLRMEQRHWLAGKWNRKQYGQDQQQINVNVNNGALHLDAMRQRNVTAVVTTPALESGEPDVELAPAEEVGYQPATEVSV